MRKRSGLFFLLLLMAGSSFGQSSLAGKIADTSGKALSFVSVTLQQNGKRVASTATNEWGQFSFSFVRDTATYFSIQFSLIGYTPVTKSFIYPDTSFLSNIILTAAVNSLGNVTVAAAKPLVTRRSDRYIINVENSFLANGNSALDVLQRSPGLWVDNNGSIKIRGNQSVTVMINDVVQRMSGDELAEYLRTLRSEDISKIEIIPNPPSEYEAAGAGGIVHIILKKARKDGLNGSVFTQYRQQGPEPLYGGGGSADYKSGKFYATGGFSLIKDINNSSGHSLNSFADGRYFKSTGTRHNDNYRQQYRLNIAYDISKTQSIVLQSNYGVTTMQHDFLNDVVQHSAAGKDVAGINATNWLRNISQTSTNLLYQVKTDTIGSVFKVKAEYTTGSREEINTFTGLYADPSQNQVVISNTPSDTKIMSAQADHLQMFTNNWQLRSGVKYAGIDRNNLVGGYPFEYHEQLFMGYASVEKLIHKTSVKMGLRAEQTWSDGSSTIAGADFSKKYFGLFPSLFISQSFNEQKGTGLSFSYARRLQRPGFNELSPYRLQLSTVTTIKGNPSLSPQYTNNFELSWQLPNSMAVTGYVSFTRDIISQLTTPVGNIFETQYLNLDKNNSYGVTIETPFKLMKTWSVYNSVSINHADYTTQSFRNSRNSFSVQHVHNIQWAKLVDIDIIAQYRSAYVNANARVADVSFMDLSFSRKILKGKGRLRLTISDIFNLTREAEQTDYLGAHSEFYQKRQTQTFGLSFNYNFSIGKKFNNKKIEQSASEEKSRL